MKAAAVWAPGVFLLEEMEERGWTREHLAGQLACSLDELEEILQARQPLTPAWADKLARVFGVAPDLFLNLEHAWASQKS